MEILIYAGSIRPGGGLTVVKIVIEALARREGCNVVVYTGAKDSSQALQPIFDKYSNVVERVFCSELGSNVRYLFSKFYFLPITLFKKDRVIISFNYFIPSFSKSLVYHINLLSFQKEASERVVSKLKKWDASLACRFATQNVFESDYLVRMAEEYTGVRIKKPKRLYIGVDSAFYADQGVVGSKLNSNQVDILMVTSPQPHKDNNTCIKALEMLYATNPEINWCITVAGGQSVQQWIGLREVAENLGVGEKVKFIGPVSKRDLSSLMRQSLCLISASKVESFCMVAVEAMASGCPVIVTNSTSMPESVGDAAIIVEAGSAMQFSEAIKEVYFNHTMRAILVEKGLQHAKVFSLSSFDENLIEIIDGI